MKRLLYGLLGAALLSLGSCQTENASESSGQPNTLSVYMTANGIEVGLAKTRATLAPETGEDRISGLYLLFFESDPAREGLFVDLVSVGGPLSMNTRLEVDLTETGLDVTEAYHILAVANVNGTEGKRYLNDMDVENWANQWIGKTERQVMTQASAWTVEGFPIKPSGLLMNGRVEKGKSQFHVDLTLSRNQVRFDVLSDVKANYELMEVQIRNAYPSSSIWNQGAPDYTNAVGRIPLYYSYPNPSPGADILGSLYAFENQVPMPVQNDRFTTALLIRLRNKATSALGWYRVNIVPAEGAQMLKRDNAYRLTIQHVGGPGFSTAQEAYDDPNRPELDYVINFWDQNNSGVIVQDGSSILSIPSKTVRIGRDGGTLTYQIFTFTNSPNPVSPLSILGQSYNPATNQINGSLLGNTLTITATPMEQNEIERRGTITLGFAGLQATVEVIQSNATDDFIQVILPNNVNIPRFAPFKGISSDLIRVSASGDWTAEIFTESAGAFSFADPAVGSIHETISSANPSDAAYITNDRFRLYTYSVNPDPSIREAFIVVSLNKDPENHAVVFRVSQAPAGGISILPSQTAVTFNGSGTGLAQIANNAASTFNVRPSKVEMVGGDIAIADWEWKLRDSGASEWSNTSAWFEVTGVVKHASNASANVFTVKAKGQNLSGVQRYATLRLRLTNDVNTYIDLQLVQQPLGFYLQPNAVSAVPSTGGKTTNIAVMADNSLQWKASITTNSGTSSDGRQLVKHAAKLYTDGGQEVNPATGYPMSTKFYVEFPKIYYPNREIPVSATVTVTVAGTLTQTLTVTQSPLTARPVSPNNTVTMRASYASIGSSSTYFSYYRNMLTNKTVFGAGRTVPVGPLSSLSSVTTLGSDRTIGNSVNYLHFNMPEMSYSNTMYGYVNTWRAAIDGVWVIVADISHEHLNSLFYGNGTNTAANSPFNQWRIGANGDADDDTNRRTLCADNTASTRIGQFLTTRGAYPISSSAGLTYFANGVSAAANISAKTTDSKAVRIIGTTDSAVGMFIDPANRVVYIGDAEFFHSTTSGSKYSNTTGAPVSNYDKFLANLISYVFNTAAYGSQFSDLLVDDSVLPAPWDAYWEGNRMNP